MSAICTVFRQKVNMKCAHGVFSATVNPRSLKHIHTNGVLFLTMNPTLFR